MHEICLNRITGCDIGFERVIIRKKNKLNGGGKKMRFKNKSGITLIALVVTIIVLLILAGISVSMLIGQNGILNRASEAKEKTEIAQKDEEKTLQGYENVINKYTSGKTVSELFDSTGEIEGKLHIGDFINYTPTIENWTEEDMEKIETTGAKIAANKMKESLPNKAYQFGGFAIGDSKSGNAKVYDANYAYIKDSKGNDITGWRLFDIAENGTVVLISAGCPEDFYHLSATNSAYISEYILTGNKNDNAINIDFSTYKPRDWSMYENTRLGAKACVLTKEKLDSWYTKNVTNGASADIYANNEIFRKVYGTQYESLIDNYSWCWLSFANKDNTLYSVNPEYRGIGYNANYAFGVRILISLPSNTKLNENSNETKEVVSRENMQKYAVWNLAQTN